MFYFWPIFALGVISILTIPFVDVTPYIYYGFAVYVWLSLFGNTIGLHRYGAHKQFELNKFWQYVCMTGGALNGHTSAWGWSVGHTELHHKYSDTDLDPTTPKRGFLGSWFGILLGEYAADQKNYVGPQSHYTSLQNPDKKTLVKYRHLWEDPYIRWLTTKHRQVFWIPTVIFALIDWKIALYSWILPIFLNQQLQCFLNWTGHVHSLGYQNGSSTDNSVNNRLFALLTWGESLHNNHHANWKQSNFSNHWSEIDLGGLVVDLIRKK